MRIAILGAFGRIGSRIRTEALARGHAVTAITRTPPDASASVPGLTIRQADAGSEAAMRHAIAGMDAVVSAVGPGAQGDPAVIPAAARTLVAAMTRGGPKRLVFVGGAGTLEIRPGVARIDTPDYPEQYRPSGIAQREALQILRASPLDWTYLSPPVIIAPGERRGAYRVGGDAVLFDDAGRSAISMEDFAVALLDEVETPRHVGRRFTVAW